MSFFKPCKWRVLKKLIFKEINDLIIESIPIVVILSFFIGAVVSIQTALNLSSPFLSKSLIGFATRQSVILEFAPTFMSIIMAGKVGSYITSSIGTMRVTEQIDALEVMGINPLNYLVFPKIIALLFYPFVITVAMFVAIFGGFVAMTFAGVPSEAFISGIQMDFDPSHVSYAYLKTILFAFILATVPSYHGFYMKGGALEVGKASTLFCLDFNYNYSSQFYYNSIIIKLMIEIKEISKSFDGNKILNNISTSFVKGKTNLIIGQSGSGKTVLLKCLLGLHSPDNGEIIYDGISNKKMNDSSKTLLRREMGMVFQGSALFDSMTVIEIFIYPTMLSDKNDEEIREKAEIAIQRVELEKAYDKLPSELSGGMQKRVAIARAIVMNPKYLFCDEPNSGLDPRTSIIIDKLIQEITKEFNITTIINSHDMNSVMEIGEKIIFLVDGEKNWEGTNKEIFNIQISLIKLFQLLKKVKKYL